MDLFKKLALGKQKKGPHILDCKCCSISYHGFSYKKCGDGQSLRLGKSYISVFCLLVWKEIVLTTFIETHYFPSSPFLLLCNIMMMMMTIIIIITNPKNRL
jgi:hypothetical protein